MSPKKVIRCRGGSRYVEGWGNPWFLGFSAFGFLFLFVAFSVFGFLVCWFLGLLVYWFIGLLVSELLGFDVVRFESFLASWSQSFNDLILPNYTSVTLTSICFYSTLALEL